MAKDNSLDEILNDEPTAEVEVAETEAETVETPQVEAEAPEELSSSKLAREKLAEDEASDAPVRDEKGRFAPKGEKQPEAEEAPKAEATPAPQDNEGTIPIAALKDERAKRQALESELNQLRQQMAQPPQPQEPQGPPNRWEDPEGYDRWLVNQVTAAAEQRATEAFHYNRIATAATQFKADKPDYDEVINVFGQMANVNPGLIAQMQASPNPPAYAYETAKQAIAINQAGSLEAYIQQEATRLAAEQAAQQQQTLASVADKLPSSPPPTISDSRSVASRSGPQWQGPQPLGDILS